MYLGRAPLTKETMPDFREWMSGYPASTSILQVDGLSKDTPILGHHSYALKSYAARLRGSKTLFEQLCSKH